VGTANKNRQQSEDDDAKRLNGPRKRLRGEFKRSKEGRGGSRVVIWKTQPATAASVRGRRSTRGKGRNCHRGGQISVSLKRVGGGGTEKSKRTETLTRMSLERRRINNVERVEAS